jgi:tryptophan-rich sensory protein
VNRTQSALAAVAAVSLAAIVGARNGPQRPSAALWYALLRKPRYTPPGPVVGAAWSVLELALGVIGYRLSRAAPARPRTVALAGWAATLAGLAGYPWLFFTHRRLGAGAAASAAMLAGAVTMTAAAAKVDRPAALLGAPLIAWLAFANVLGDQLWLDNPRLSADRPIRAGRLRAMVSFPPQS